MPDRRDHSSTERRLFARSPRLRPSLSVTLLTDITTRPAIAPVPAVPALASPWAAGPGPCRGSRRRRAHHAPEPSQSPWLRAPAAGRAGRRQRRVRIYRSEVIPPAALTAPPVLQRWSAWEELRGAGRNRRIPPGPGLYRIRRTGGEPGLDYIGQTGRSLRGRLGQLTGVYHAQMPYRDPRTAAPALRALRQRDGCDFEVAVIQVPGTAAQRKALEATAITVYRIDSGRSPAASFGRSPPGTGSPAATTPGWPQPGGATAAARTRQPRPAPPAHRSTGCQAQIQLLRAG